MCFETTTVIVYMHLSYSQILFLCVFSDNFYIHLVICKYYLCVSLCFQECEYCRLNAECFLNASETERCQELCGRDYTSVQNFSTLFSGLRSDELRSRHLLNFYGQVTYRQFIGICYSDL